MQGLLNSNNLLGSSIFGVGGGSNIKSIQRGLTSMGTSTYQNITIESVDINSSIALIEDSGIGLTGETQLTAKITSASNLQILRGFADTSSPDVSSGWQIIEFNNVKSLQKGSVLFNSQGNQTTNVTINNIDTEKSIAVCSVRHGYEYGTASAEIILNSSTQIVINCSVPNNVNTYVEWQIIEFK